MCREVAKLVEQVGERDFVIQRLVGDKKKFMKTINELKTSDHADEPVGGETRASSVTDASMKSSGVNSDWEGKLQAVEEEKRNALADVAKLTARVAAAEREREAAEEQRAALANGLDRAQKQLTALHTQWEQEKKELMEANTKDDHKAVALAAERDRLRRENDALKQRVRETEMTHKAAVDALQVTANESDACAKRLQAELNAANVALSQVRKKDQRISSLEVDIFKTRHALEQNELEVKSLRNELDTCLQSIQETKVQHSDQISKLEQRIFEAEIIRRILHNKVS